MGIIRHFIGAKSKYEQDIPYLYEARIKVLGDEYNSYMADTICALIEYLADHEFDSDEVEIFEIFKGEEKKLELNYCISGDGKWLSRSELCDSFKAHYPGHIYEGGCTFEDRQRDITKS